MEYNTYESGESQTKKTETSGFSQHARALLSAGFIPLSVRPGSKAACRNWPSLDPDDIAEMLEDPRLEGWGLSVRCDGVAVIDIDLKDSDPRLSDVKHAIWRALRESEVEGDDIIARRGSKGAALIFRAAGEVAPRQWKDAGGQVIAEVLSGPKRHCVIPPTLHPATSRPYEWLTPRTLFDLRSIDDLPSLDQEAIDRIGEALAPWLAATPPERQRPPLADHGRGKTTPTDISPRDLRRLRAWAQKALESRATELAASVNGRRDCAFISGLKMGPFVAAGIIAEDEVIEALKPAWEACRRAPGSNRIRPADELDRQILNGLRRGAESPLPPLNQ